MTKSKNPNLTDGHTDKVLKDRVFKTMTNDDDLVKIFYNNDRCFVL